MLEPTEHARRGAQYAALTDLFRWLGVSPAWLRLAERIETDLQPLWTLRQPLEEYNQLKVLAALQEQDLTPVALAGSTGYGYGDVGREGLEAAYARVFGAEAALVRPQIASGTHALKAALFGLLRPGDTLISATGAPYDTLQTVIGVRPAGRKDSGKVHAAGPQADIPHAAGAEGTLRQWGIDYVEVPLTAAHHIDVEALLQAMRGRRGVVLLQRSRGYSLRPSLSMAELEPALRAVAAHGEGRFRTVVDNCYGEFVEGREPPEAGADLAVGSLIKNPGGGLAPSGGYVVGKRDLVEQVAASVTAPGLGLEVGATYGWLLPVFQGLFLAPTLVGQALRGAMFAAALWEHLGFSVSPRPQEERTDLVQCIVLGEPRRLQQFCQAIQRAGVVDSRARPTAWDMPGYADQVIMAAGGFISGSSSELSADAPMRPPYAVFLQGGLVYPQIKLGNLLAAQEIVGEPPRRERLS